jgi:hypothetical protein
MLDFMLGRLNEFARIVMCGAISDYSKLLISASPPARRTTQHETNRPPHALCVRQTRLNPTLSETTKP